MSFLISVLTSPNAILAYKFVYYSAPVWITLILWFIAWDLWINYKRMQFISSQKYILLEIKMPKEIFKSPAAMEFLFNAVYQSFGETVWNVNWNQFPPKINAEYYWKGSVRPWFSFEICSIQGKVHFFIWTRAGNKALIEAQLYSQYPGVEIYEVPDYTLPVSYDAEHFKFAVNEFVLTKPDPYPIKTYIDYGMDKDPKEEYRIDPLTPLIEYLGSLPQDQEVWLQIVITAHKATDKVKDPKTGAVSMKDLKWSEAAKTEVQKILDKAKPPKPKEGEPVQNAPRSLTDVERETVTALERSVTKKGFDVGIRMVYFAPIDKFNPGVGGAVGAALSHFNSPLNGFKGNKVISLEDEKQHVFDAYKNRGYFWADYKGPNFVLNTEELATLYHLPAGITTTPAFDRIGSKKAQAPSNLPL